MTYDVRRGFRGLFTNIAETGAKPEMLRVADNVVVRQPGAIEPRQGFAPYEIGYSLAFTDMTQAEPHGEDMVVETNGGWRAADGTMRTLELVPNSTPVNTQKYRADAFSVALMRGNMYLPHLRGVAVAPNADAVDWRNAGLCTGFWNNSSSTGSSTDGWLETGFHVAYRILQKRTDENGLVIRSAPSGAEDVANGSGVARNTQLTPQWLGSTYWNSYHDTFEIYRTRQFPIGTACDDEMALVASLGVDEFGSIDVPFTWEDTCPDELRGAALYTSPSREGFEGKNDPPPSCAAIEPYRGHMFFGDCGGPQRIVVSHGLKDCTGLGDGIGWRDVTGDVTNGSTTITNISSMVGVQVGMVVTDGSNNAYGYIVSYVGTTIVISDEFFSATGAATPLCICDAIQVDGQWIPVTYGDNFGAYIGVDPLAGIEQTVFETVLHSGNSASGVGDHPAGKFSGTRITPPLSGYAHTRIIEHTVRADGPFPLRGTHGKEMYPQLPLGGIDPPVYSEADVYPNMLMWSKQEEPEHVPPTNYVLIGEKTKRILALCHTRDSLFIFKEDGIWRLSGYAGQWSIDPFDMTCFCILPSSVRRLNNRIFMLSNQGVVAVSENGVEPVSFAIADQTRRLIDDVRTNFEGDGYYHLTGISGVAATVDDRNSEYLLLVGDAALDLNGAQVLVYNELSSSWTTFSFTTTGQNGFDPQALGLTPDNTPLVLHNGGLKTSSYATETTLGQTTRRMFDGEATALTTTSIADNGTTATLVVSTPITLVAGADVLTDDTGIDYDIENIISTTAFTVTVPDGTAAPSGLGSVRRGYQCTVQPHGFFGSVQVGKYWSALEVGFSRLVGPVKLVAAFSSSQPLVPEGDQEVDQEFELYRDDGVLAHHLGTLARIGTLPLDHARAWLLRVRLSWLAVRGLISLELVQLDARTVSPTKPQQSSSGIA